MLFGLHEIINIFKPIYTNRETSHRKSNFLASLEKLKALALLGPYSYLIMTWWYWVAAASLDGTYLCQSNPVPYRLTVVSLSPHLFLACRRTVFGTAPSSKAGAREQKSQRGRLWKNFRRSGTPSSTRELRLACCLSPSPLESATERPCTKPQGPFCRLFKQNSHWALETPLG